MKKQLLALAASGAFALSIVNAASASVFSGRTPPRPSTEVNACDYQEQLNRHVGSVVREEVFFKSTERDFDFGALETEPRWNGFAGNNGGMFAGHHGTPGNRDPLGEYRDNGIKRRRGWDKHGERHGREKDFNGVTPTPEPAAWILIASALGATAVLLRYRRRPRHYRMLG